MSYAVGRIRGSRSVLRSRRRNITQDEWIKLRAKRYRKTTKKKSLVVLGKEIAGVKESETVTPAPVAESIESTTGAALKIAPHSVTPSVLKTKKEIRAYVQNSDYAEGN